MATRWWQWPAKLTRLSFRLSWPPGLFLLLGFAPTLVLGNPVVGMALAVGAIMPFGSRAAGIGLALIRGLVLGAFAGLGIVGGLSFAYAQRQLSNERALLFIAATMVMCTGAAVLFQHLAERRREHAEQEWRD